MAKKQYRSVVNDTFAIANDAQVHIEPGQVFSKGDLPDDTFNTLVESGALVEDDE